MLSLDALVEVAEALPTVVTVGVALWGASIAERGLRTWRTQLTGTVSYELARKIILAAHEVLEAVAAIRATHVSKDERLASSSSSSSGEERSFAPRYRRRLSRLDAPAGRLQAALAEARATWPDDATKVKDLGRRVEEQLHELRSCIDLHCSLDERDNDSVKRVWNALFASDNVGVGKEMRDAVEEIETLVYPHIATRASSFRRLRPRH